MLKKIIRKVTLKFSVAYCTLKRSLSAYLQSEFFLIYPNVNPQPFSDAELELCKDLLNRSGYTLLRREGGTEIILYRMTDLQEAKKAAEAAAQILSRGVL